MDCDDATRARKGLRDWKDEEGNIERPNLMSGNCNQFRKKSI